MIVHFWRVVFGFSRLFGNFLISWVRTILDCAWNVLSACTSDKAAVSGCNYSTRIYNTDTTCWALTLLDWSNSTFHGFEICIGGCMRDFHLFNDVLFFVSTSVPNIWIYTLRKKKKSCISSSRRKHTSCSNKQCLF